MGVWSNGEKISFYQRKDPNYFEDIPDIPHVAQKLKDILRERRTIANLIDDDKLLRENKTLSDLIRELEDEVLANAGVDVFEEVFKLIYTKLYDEMLGGRDTSRVLEFWNYGETDADLKDTIQNLFDRAKEKWPGIFADGRIEHFDAHVDNVARREILTFLAFLGLADQIFKGVVDNVKVRMEKSDALQ